MVRAKHEWSMIKMPMSFRVFITVKIWLRSNMYAFGFGNVFSFFNLGS